MKSGGPQRHWMVCPEQEEEDKGEGTERFNEHNGYFEQPEQWKDELSGKDLWTFSQSSFLFLLLLLGTGSVRDKSLWPTMSVAFADS